MIAKVVIPFTSSKILGVTLMIAFLFINIESHGFIGFLSNSINLLVSFLLHVKSVYLRMFRKLVYYEDIGSDLRKLFIKMHKKIDSSLIL